jgi:hypothetical protein
MDPSYKRGEGAELAIKGEGDGSIIAKIGNPAAEIPGEIQRSQDFSKSGVNDDVKGSFDVVGKKGWAGFVMIAGVWLTQPYLDWGHEAH